MKLLHIDASILAGASVSRELSQRIVEKLLAEFPDTEVIYRDLVGNELPHVTRATLPSAHRLALDVATLDEAGRRARDESDAVLSEF